jgi:hypothetical protein
VSEGIEFALPLWRAEVYHNTPNTEGVWHKVFNMVPGATNEEIVKEIQTLFEADGLNAARINRIYFEELLMLGGEEDG